MIKLQLLLREPASQPELAPALRARIEALGWRVTGSGRASVTVELDDAAAARLPPAVPPSTGGFALLSAPALSVPPELSDAVSAISIAPRHTPNG